VTGGIVHAPSGHLLVPLDLSRESERAIAIAGSLAARAGGMVTLHHAAAGAPEAAEAQQRLRRLAGEEARSTSIPVEVVVEERGDRSAPAAIASAATRSGATICMASHGRSGIARAVLGSVAHATLQLVDQPVVLVGPQVTIDDGATTLMACVDGSPEAEHVVPVARTWAEALDLSMTLVQVVEPATPLPEAGIPPAFMDGSYLAGLCERVDGAGATYDVLHGEPVSAIVRYARTPPATSALIAVAARARTGLIRRALGSVSMQLVHRAACPVIVLPAGHRTDRPG
jgi:nucleotide-binding universal stress UspA family protein